MGHRRKGRREEGYACRMVMREEEVKRGRKGGSRGQAQRGNKEMEAGGNSGTKKGRGKKERDPEKGGRGRARAHTRARVYAGLCVCVVAAARRRLAA